MNGGRGRGGPPPLSVRGEGGSGLGPIGRHINTYPLNTRDLLETLSPTSPRYTCMASMEVDPELSDTLMHLSGYIFRAAINAGLRGK